MGEVVLLIGHGTQDPDGRREIVELLAHVRAALPAHTVELGVLEFAGADLASVDDALARCVQRGTTQLRLVPLLLHSGMHARSDVPAVARMIERDHPELGLAITPSLTAEPALLDIVEERIAAGGAECGPALGPTITLLVGRGSSEAAANADFFRTARLLAERSAGRAVECCFVSLAQPDVPAALERCRRLGARQVVVVPYFLNTGTLVKRIARQAASFRSAHPEVDVVVTPHLGVDERVVALVRDRVAGTAAAPRLQVTSSDPVAWNGAARPVDERPRLETVESPPTLPLLERYGLPPADIEALSQRRIAAALPRDGLSEPAWTVVQRMVYAAGDPRLARLICMHPDAIEAAVAALARGEPVLTDVRMVDVALDRGRLAKLGITPRCAIDAASAALARPGLTRTAAGMLALADGLEGGVVVVGNAPTALLALLDLVDQGRARPAAIVGTPVGFVAAAEAKAELAARGTPFITVTGTRGGSAIAAAAGNALLRLACGAPAEVRV